jgi:hypothetical protein
VVKEDMIMAAVDQIQMTEDDTDWLWARERPSLLISYFWTLLALAFIFWYRFWRSFILG